MRLLLAFVAVMLLPADSFAQTKFERGGPLDADGAFRMHTLDGSVRVTGWDRDSILVRGTLPGGLKPMAGGSRSGWKMSIYEGVPATKGSAQLQVFVPRGAQVWIKGTSATVSVTGLTGSVDLNTIEGRIEATGSPRELRIETMRGHVTVNGAPRWMRLKSGDGDITFGGESADAVLSTVQGSITTTSRLQRGRVETVEGTVRITGPIGSGALLDVDTHSGPVSMVLDPPVNATFSLFTVSGRIINGIGKSGPKKAAGTGTSLEFAAGTGKARVTVRTFSGSVTLTPR